MTDALKTTKLAPSTTVPTGVTFDRRRGLYRARTRDSIQLHLGYFRDVRLAARAVTVTGVSIDNSRIVSKHRVRINGEHIGYYKTRTDAVRAALKVL